MVELAWLWLQNQPTSALSLWFRERVRRLGGRMRKTIIVALARKLLVAPMAVHDRWRRHRGGRDEGSTGDNLTPSARTESVLPDPGGRTEMTVGLNSRPKEWSRPPEPHPPYAGCWCSRKKRRPYVSLIWCSMPSGHGNGLRPWIPTSDRKNCSSTPKSDPLTSNMPM